ncbi:Hypothetical predicted protein [Podarcis lilfordi]|uniref:Uncharacterized protein n=1 Tax=Podarcis lilfordi TaxID=74358 RepID=A0AA35KN08_9SAUR|nr:Hypothetical predicted protein [Podarcis lilfordi]
MARPPLQVGQESIQCMEPEQNGTSGQENGSPRYYQTVEIRTMAAYGRVTSTLYPTNLTLGMVPP